MLEPNVRFIETGCDASSNQGILLLVHISYCSESATIYSI